MMIIKTKISVATFKTENPRVKKLLDDVVAAGTAESLDQMLDLIWQPDGLTYEDWVKYFEEEEAHIRARYIN